MAPFLWVESKQYRHQWCSCEHHGVSSQPQTHAVRHSPCSLGAPSQKRNYQTEILGSWEEADKTHCSMRWSENVSGGRRPAWKEIAREMKCLLVLLEKWVSEWWWKGPLELVLGSMGWILPQLICTGVSLLFLHCHGSSYQKPLQDFKMQSSGPYPRVSQWIWKMHNNCISQVMLMLMALGLHFENSSYWDKK